MTKKEKAKAYDEAYKVAENILKYSSDPAEIKRMEEIFPELKESEDERIRKDIEFFIAAYHKEDAEKAHWLAWLEKQGEQKPAWSEADEEMRENILCFLSEHHEYNNEYYWFKSLRPQNTWKPSEEQMRYLSWIANIKLGDSVVEQEVSKHLNELLEDLKKLREE